MTESPGESPGPLSIALAEELRATYGQLKRRLREETQLGELSWPQLRVLHFIDREGPSTVTALARTEGIRPQSMGETVSSLRSTGLLTGAPDPADGRQTVLSLTAEGLRAITAGRAARQDWLSRTVASQLTVDEQQLLIQAIALLKRIANA